MKIGIFGGSFDPVHSQHIALARHAIEELQLDKLFILPAYAPPHKRGKVLAADSHRLEMCRLAFADVPKAEVSDYEITAQGTSYTYLTLRRFAALYPTAKLYFLVGTDMLRDFPTWKRPEEILTLATLAVCSRAEQRGWEVEELVRFRARFGCDFLPISYVAQDVSSTEIRVLAGAGIDLTPFVGESVAEYIEKNHLYESTGAKQSLALQSPKRAAHSVRVALMAAKKAQQLKLDEGKAICAALLHDCAKNLEKDSPLLNGFIPPKGVPPPVLHQYAGAYVAKTSLGVTDGEVLSAIECHTSGKPNMSPLDKLIFLADLVEEERTYDGAERLRALFWTDFEECLRVSLRETVAYLTDQGGEIYEKTLLAYDYYQEKKE